MEGAENVSLLFTVSRSSCEDADKSGPVVAAAERSPDTKEQSEGRRGGCALNRNGHAELCAHSDFAV